MDSDSDLELSDIPHSQLVSSQEILELCSENGIEIGRANSSLKTVTSTEGVDSRSQLEFRDPMSDIQSRTQLCQVDTNLKETHRRKRGKSSGRLFQSPNRHASGNDISIKNGVDSGCCDEEMPLLVLQEQVQPTVLGPSTGQGMGTSGPSPENPGKQSSQKRKSIREQNLVKRMKGESYVGFTKARNPVTGKMTSVQDQPRGPRQLGETCTSLLCMKRKQRLCSEFQEIERRTIFNDFWSMDWNGKRALVSSLVDHTKPKRRIKDCDTKRKTETRIFHLKSNGVRKQVCRNMFLRTLGIGEKQLRTWVSTPWTPNPSRNLVVHNYPSSRNAGKGGDRKFAERFLDDLPKLPSHYCRKDTNKMYLEPLFRSFSQLMEVYKEKCTEVVTNPISSRTFYRLVDQKNIAIHQPKKDRCDICCGYEAKNITESDYQNHISRKETAREEKTNDKALALKREAHVITMDVQKVLLCPMLNASALYYKTKLIVHNFTIFDLGSKIATCYLWDETQAELVASVFATCLLDYFQTHYKDDLKIIIFSDGATSQNRNAILSNALIHYAVKNKKTVIQKYLEKGHTQMEVDSVHAHIECNLKGKQIYHPKDYQKICETARKSQNAYLVRNMKFSDILDYTQDRPYQSIRPGSKKGDPHVTDLRQIKYNPDGSLEYKINHTDDWKAFPQKKRVDPSTSFKKLYKKQLPITKRKYEDLQQLLSVIPAENHNFYKKLPFK